MNKITLPALPGATELSTLAFRVGIYGFTADQLRARDRQIVELCAQICDQVRSVSAVSYETGAYCAAAIRSLLDEKKEEEQ